MAGLVPVDVTADRRIDRLPVLPNRLIGRETEIEQVRGLLKANRLVTLTGPGGVGKTRLAIEAARASAGCFPNGVSFVSLAPVRDQELVLPAIAQALGVSNAGSITTAEKLAVHLVDQTRLLVLDNLEQVLDAGPEIASLLGISPTITILTTSRVVLRLQSERVFEVPPLALPAARQGITTEDLANSAAIELFVERAQEVDSSFVLDEHNGVDVAGICVRLDGLPLAIELAAARVRMLSPGALLPRLERRLPLLTGGPRDVPARQQTLRDTLAWSYNLLAPGEQAIFRRLSVFFGGFTLEAAETVNGLRQGAAKDESATVGVFDVIATLTDHCLVRQMSQGDEPRFVMLETVLEYGRELLESHGEVDETRRRHAEWVAEYRGADPPGNRGPQWSGSTQAI